MAKNGNGRAANTKTVNLALQGGGSHGAFTWGVLDALLEDGRVRFEGASGTSAGVMNAVVMAHALARARANGQRGQSVNEAARAALARFWDGVGVLGSFMSGLPLPAAQAVGSWFAQWLSPYQANPFGLNPLRDLIKREVDFDLLAQQRYLKVFVAATNVRTGRGEIFSGARVSADAVMASACLPAMFQAVQIEGEYYWDGGYSGNPAIYPLIYETRSADMLLVQINPIESPYKPGASAPEIMERVFEPYVTTKARGTGLGLAIVKKIIDEHQGRISIKNRPQGGAEVSIRLPLAPGREARKEEGE